MQRNPVSSILKVMLVALAIGIIMISISIAGDIPQVSINQATAEELTVLPGIGKKKAEAIVAYREKNGKFGNIEDIEKVDGIGKDTLEKIRSHIVIK